MVISAQSHWRHNERDGVSNRLRLDCLLNRVFRHKTKKTSKLGVTGLCEGNPPVTGGFPSQRASNGENVSIWWRHHALLVRHAQTWPTCPKFQSSDANRHLSGKTFLGQEDQRQDNGGQDGSYGAHCLHHPGALQPGRGWKRQTVQCGAVITRSIFS